MAYDASQFINERYIEMPSNRQVGEQTVWRVFSQLVSYASSDELLVYVSDRTQATNSGIDRRSVRNARTLLVQAGLMRDTGKVKAKGVIVWQLQIPGYQPACIPPTELVSSGQVSGRVKGRDSGQVSGQVKGRDSGGYTPPQTELNTTNINRNKTNQNFDEKIEYDFNDPEVVSARNNALAQTKQMLKDSLNNKKQTDKPDRTQLGDGQSFLGDQVSKFMQQKINDNNEPF